MANRHPHHVKHAGMHNLFRVKRTSNPAIVQEWLAFTNAGYVAPYKVQVSYRKTRMSHIEIFDVAYL